MKNFSLLTILFVLQFSASYPNSIDSSKYERYLKLGQTARLDGNIDQSINYLLESRKYAETETELLKVFNSLGSSYFTLSDFHSALNYYDSVKTLLDTTLYPVFSCYLTHNYALVYMQLEEFEKAITNYKLASACMDKHGKGILYFNLGKCYDYLNKPEEAKTNYKLSYQFNIETKGKADYYSILAGLELVEHGDDILESLHASVLKLNNNQLSGLYYSLKGNYIQAEKYLQGNNDYLLSLYTKSHQWEKAINVIDSLRKSYLSLNSKLFLQKNEMLIYKGAVDIALKTDTLQALRFAQKSYGNIMRDRIGSGPSELMDSYNYFDFDSVIYLFKVINKKVEYYRIEANDEFWEYYSDFLRTIKDDTARRSSYYQNYLTYCKSAVYLFEKLLPEISKNMLVVAGGRLQYLPFECLLTSPPNDTVLPNYKDLPYLLHRSTIYYDYILRNYKQSNGTKSIVAFAPDTTIKFAIEEINALRIFKSKRLIGKDAKLEHMGDGNILHISTHYSPLNYSIEFSDGSLDLNNIPQQHRDLVILSTCLSGEGILHNGEGIFSPGRAFYISGAESIIESSWNASDGHSLYIIWNFYKQLLLRKNKAQAMRKSKLKYLSNCPEYMSQPYYWANYRVYGNNSAIRFKLGPIIPVSIALIFGLLILIVILLKNLIRRM